MKRILLFANGEFSQEEFYLKNIKDDDFIICADGSVNFLYQLAKRPDLIVGDMDSADPRILALAEQEGSQIIRYPAEKNESDLELALMEAIKREPEEIVIFGALGKRLDHLLANLMLLLLPLKVGIKASIYEEDYQIYLTDDQIEIEGRIGEQLSIFPIEGSAKGLETEGLKYPLKNENLYLASARGLSNVFLADKARIKVREGKILIIKTS